MGMQIQAGMWEIESPQRSGLEGARPVAGDERATSSDSLPAGRVEARPRSLWAILYKDYRRYRAAGARNALSVVALTQGFWASAIFRLSHWALARFTWPILRTMAKVFCLLFQKFIEVITGISIPARSHIGPGLYIGHFGGIFVDSDCRIGENCNLSQGVTIGKGGRGELHGVPTLGDRVHVGANALILGRISIGNDAVIGPGAVVMDSVPPRGVAMGNPARVVGLEGSFDFVNYDDKENDPARKAAQQTEAA